MELNPQKYGSQLILWCIQDNEPLQGVLIMVHFMRHCPVKSTTPTHCTISDVGETKSLWAVRYYWEYRTGNGRPFSSSWDLSMNAQTSRPACTVFSLWCWQCCHGICCTVQMFLMGFCPFFFLSWALRRRSCDLWNVEVLEAQDIMHRSLGNCCGFAQVVRKRRRGLLTLRREKHISRLFLA